MTETSVKAILSEWVWTEEKSCAKQSPKAPLLFPCPPSRGMSTVSPRLNDRCEIFPPNTNIFSDFSCRIYTRDREQTTVTADSFFSHLFLQLPFNSLTNRSALCEERLCWPHKMICCKKDTHYCHYCRCFPTQDDGRVWNFITIFTIKKMFLFEDLLRITSIMWQFSSKAAFNCNTKSKTEAISTVSEW